MELPSRAALPALALAALILAPALSGGAAGEEPVTLSRFIGASFLVVACGPVLTEPFSIPDDAIVTNASLHATADLANTTALDATVEVRAGGVLLASNTTSAGLGWLGLNASLDVKAINAVLLNQSATSGAVALALEITVCPTLGAASVRIDEASITYLRTALNGSGNGTGTALPDIIGVSVNGVLNGSVESGTPATLAVTANGTLGADVQVSWFVDGALVGHGAVLANYTFSPGPHNVTVRASDGSAVRTYSVAVSAATRPAPTPGINLFLIAGIAGIAIVGIGVAGTDAGRYLLLSLAIGSVFARLKKASLLDHFVRGTLYQVIRENPGIHFAELRRRAHLANGAAAHHLRMLEKGGYLRVIIDGTKTKFYATDRPMEPEVYGISDTDRAILSAVTDAPGIGQGDLALRLGRSPSVISRSVARLVALGYVTTTHDGARVQVFPRAGAEAPDPLATVWPDEGA